jgi:glycosyltransferase involved in cell wall biosynthesis
MRKVLICKNILLPISETFIRDQALAYTSWKPVLVGVRSVASGLALGALDVRILEKSEPRLWGTLYRKLLAEIGMPSPGLVQRLKTEKASLVHVHFATDAVFYWPIVRRLGLPLLITLHGYDINIYREFWEQGFPPLGHRRYPRRLLTLSRQPKVRFIAVSEAIKQRAIEYGIPSDRIDVRYIGIDLTRFRPSGLPIPERRRRILYVGRLVEKKGAEILIRAYVRVRSALPGAELAMVGDGPLARDLATLAKELDAPVEFLGSADGDEVKRQIDMARVFCLPSITAENGDAEGLGIVILEAQASGVPVITSARGGATEGIIDGVTGFAFPERDIEALTSKLISILVNDDMAASMSLAGPRFIESTFDIRRCTTSLEGLYDSFTEIH